MAGAGEERLRRLLCLLEARAAEEQILVCARVEVVHPRQPPVARTQVLLEQRRRGVGGLVHLRLEGLVRLLHRWLGWECGCVCLVS